MEKNILKIKKGDLEIAQYDIAIGFRLKVAIKNESNRTKKYQISKKTEEFIRNLFHSNNVGNLHLALKDINIFFKDCCNLVIFPYSTRFYHKGGLLILEIFLTDIY